MFWAVILFFILMILVFICVLSAIKIDEASKNPVVQAMFASLFSGSVILIITVSYMFICCVSRLMGGAAE
jgi:hypothetical protein